MARKQQQHHAKCDRAEEDWSLYSDEVANKQGCLNLPDELSSQKQTQEFLLD